MAITRRAAIVGAALSAVAVAQKAQADRYPDAAPYVPSPIEIVDAMLDLAGVQQHDVVYDLGCGDGRIVVAAARKYGASGVGVDVDTELLAEARGRAQAAGVGAKTRFVEADIFETDIRPATVVTLYLMPKALSKLKPKLLSDLKPGSRVVSFTFPIEGWPPAKVKEVDSRRLYLWVIPERP
jgi:SAM-dependent methyltransferase